MRRAEIVADMLFGKKERTIRRILIVEDEPLVAFDSEHFLQDAGFEIVGTVDRVDAAILLIEADGLDLVLADVRLSDDGDGIDVARAATERGIPVLFVTGACPEQAQSLAIGCLAKPYTLRDLLAALDAIEATLTGARVKKLPPGLSLFS